MGVYTPLHILSGVEAMKSLSRAASCLLCLMLGYSMTASSEPEATPAPAIVHSTCFMCHSEHGGDPELSFVPRLAAQNAAYIEEQVAAFRDGSRADPAAILYMWPISQNLSDEQLKQAAEWYAAQPAPKTAPAASGTDEGQAIYTKGILASDVPACVSCHGDKAAGNGIFPRLAGQNAQYLLAQLRFFRAGVRNDKSADIMKPVAVHMTDAQMSAVAKYLSGL
jgi:cytochrome c553